MKEGYRSSEGKNSPWAFEPGSSVENLETAHEQLQVFCQNIRQFVEENDITAEVEMSGDFFVVAPEEREHMALVLGYLKPALKNMNETLSLKEVPFHFIFSFQGSHITIALKKK